MTLDEAINHAEEVAEEQVKLCKRYDDASGYSRSHNETIRVADAKKCEKCAEEHRQLAEWLRDYKRLLEQQPSEDCVSRKQALIGIRNLYPGIPFTRQNVKKWKEENKKYFECENVIRDLPSVAPKTNWIPVSERLPDDEQMVLVCSNTGNIEVSCGSRSTEIKDKFIWYTSGWKFGEVAAWMPLPEPYQEE